MESPSRDTCDEEDSEATLSYFSSFNRQSFEADGTTAQQQAHDAPVAVVADFLHDDSEPQKQRVPHPPMRSTLTPINIPLPSKSPPAAEPKQDRRRTPTGKKSNPLQISSGSVATIVQQHCNSMVQSLASMPSAGQPVIPTIVMQPVLMGLTQQQQLHAAQLQENFFGLIKNAGQTAPLVVVTPNLQQGSPQPQQQNPTFGYAAQVVQPPCFTVASAPQ